MEYDIKIVVALIGTFGVVLAALLSAIGYLVKNNIDKKKGARRVLYFLLEIRNSIRTELFDPSELTDKYIDHYINQLKTKANVELKSSDFDKFREMMQVHFTNLVNSTRIDIEARLIEPFEKELLNLASINPVLAYKLRGKEILGKVVKHTNEYQDQADEVIKQQVPEEWAQVSLSGSMVKMKSSVLSELYDVIDQDCILLSKECGRRDHKACRDVIANSDLRNKSEEDFEDLDHYIDEMIIGLVKAANRVAGGL
ncbi:MAG: hypothetical protein RPU61_11020 [Candidatus Sedimenticola sp. (ex Thyasira tokunagai)]